jgi:hypothetical protein
MSCCSSSSMIRARPGARVWSKKSFKNGGVLPVYVCVYAHASVVRCMPIKQVRENNIRTSSALSSALSSDRLRLVDGFQHILAVSDAVLCHPVG